MDNYDKVEDEFDDEGKNTTHTHSHSHDPTTHKHQIDIVLSTEYINNKTARTQTNAPRFDSPMFSLNAVAAAVAVAARFG